MQLAEQPFGLSDAVWRDQRVHLRTIVPGPKSRALRHREQTHVAPGLQGYAVMSGVAIESGAGSLLTDVDGNALLDFIGGIGVGALGHSHPRIVRAISDQVARLSVGSFTSAPRVELVESVASHAPSPELHRLQLYTSGAEAVESALRLARAHTGKHEFVSFWGGFHGKTHGALSLLGSSAGKRGYGPMAGGTHRIPYADCYRCPLQLSHPSCGLACVELGRKQLRAQSSGAIAAFIVEPMQGTAGNVVPPDDFLPAVQQLAREHGALLIADEMITGFGRTGRYWGTSHAGVIPDIVTIGKAFGGGFPLSGLLTTDAIARAKPWSNPSGSSSSYGGNALGAAAGAAALRVIDDENLVDNARSVGACDARRATPDGGGLPVRGPRPRARPSARPRARLRQADAGTAAARGDRAHLPRVCAPRSPHHGLCFQLPDPARADHRPGHGGQRARHRPRRLRRAEAP